MALRNLLVRIGADLSGLQKGMKQAQGELKSFHGNIASTMGKIKATLAAVGGAMALGSAINDAIKYEALMGTIGETLGSTANDFVKWSETTGAAMGLSKLAAAEMGNTFSLKFKGIAKDAQDNFRMTTDLMKAAAIIRTKTGMQEVEIMDRMRSAMNQEADGADELGVNVRVAAITASKAYKEMANGVPWADLNKNQQTLILQAYITDSIYSKLGNTVANNTALLKGQFLAALNDTKLALGQAFLPILNIALPLLTTLMRKVESAFKFFAGFMRAMFPKSNIAAGNAQVKTTDKQTSSIGKQQNAVDGLSNSVKNLGKAKKKASNGVAGFDQINSLSSASATDGGAGGGGSGDVFSGIGDDANAAQDDVNNLGDVIAGVTDKVKAFVAQVKEWLAPIKPYWDDLKESIENIGVALSDVWNSKDGKEFKTWLTSGWDLGLSGVLEILAGFGDVFAGIIRTVWGGLTGDWKMMWEGAGDIVKGLIEILNGTFGPLFPDLMKKVKEFTDGFKEKWDSLLNINWLAIGVEALKAFVQMKNDINKVWDDITAVASTVAGNIWSAISGKFADVKSWFTTKFGEIPTALGGFVDDVGTKAGETWSAIKAKFSGAYDWFRDYVIKAPYNAFVNWKDLIANKAGESWTAIKGKFTGAYDWFRDNVVKAPYNAFINWKDSIASKAGDVWTAVKGKFTGAYDWFKTNVVDKISLAFGKIKYNVTDGLYNSVKGLINKLIDLINKPLKEIKSWSFMGSKPFGGLPTIPKLAKGGIVNSPTLAMVGEAGKEAVMPLENNTGWINELASKLNGMGGGNSGPIEVTLQLNETKLGKVAISSINKVHRQSGKILLNL
jgi:hypothetical protein